MNDPFDTPENNEPKTPKPRAIDIVAKSQLSLIHAASTRPLFDWSVIQHLAQLWQATNGARYRQAGVQQADVRATLRMVFRDYIAEIRQDNVDEADRFRRALGPELDM
jgi:hypothetical protein